MLRRILWIIVATYPLLIYVIVFFATEQIDHFLANLLPPFTALSDWLLTYWWLIALALIGVHYVCFIVSPIFNKTLTNNYVKFGWACANLIAWPLSPIFYLWFCTNKLRPLRSI
jgi:hypothetical protein